MRIGRSRWDGLVVLLLTPCCGCGMVSRNFPRMQNPAPVVRARSIAQGDGRRNPADLASLIVRLEDADPVVRLTTHEELRRRTRRDFGYVPWASPQERAAAVDRWRAWLARTTDLPSSPGTITRGAITEDP